MKNIYLLLLYIFYNHFFLIKGSCLDGCSNHGTCIDNQCNCFILYQGTNCSIKWTNDPSWLNVFYFYISLELFLMVIILIFSSYQLYIQFIFQNKYGRSKWNVVTYMLVCFIVASVLRILDFGVDPDSFRGIYPRVVEQLLFVFPLIIWLAVGFLQFLYWIELQRMSGIKQLRNVVKLKPVLFIMIGLLVIILPPISIWQAIVQDNTSNDVYNAMFVIIFVILMGLSYYSGNNLRKVVKNIWKTTKITEYKKFLKKLVIYIFIFNSIFILAVITLVIYSATNAANNRWEYVSISIVLRIEEFLVIFSTLCFLYIKKPAPERDDTSQTSISSKNEDIDSDNSKEEPCPDIILDNSSQ